MRIVTSLFFILITILFTASFADERVTNCQKFLTTNEQVNQETQVFVAYLTELVTQKELSVEDLQNFLKQLESGNLVSPVSREKIQTSSNAKIQNDVFQNLINTGDIDLKNLKLVVKKLTSQISNEFRSKEIVQENTALASTLMEFIKLSISRDSVDQGQNIDENLPQIEYQIEVMKTPVTQRMWVDIMKRNPSWFKGDEGLSIVINGKNIRLQHDHPVESMTIWSAMVFANLLSISKRLKPAYDLSGIEWDTLTSAQEGNLKPLEKPEFDEIYGKIVSDYKRDSDRFLHSEGYRLPDTIEYSLLMKAVTPKKLWDRDLEWLPSADEFTTHPVATKAPRKIGNDDIYDVIGNVHVMIHENVFMNIKRRSNVMLLDNITSTENISEEDGLDDKGRNKKLSYDSAAHDLGFRLVRTVKKK